MTVIETGMVLVSCCPCELYTAVIRTVAMYGFVMVAPVAGAETVTVVEPPKLTALGESWTETPWGEFVVSVTWPFSPLMALVPMVKLAEAPPCTRVTGEGWVSAKSSTVMPTEALLLAPVASVTVIAKLYCPAVLGVPVRLPLGVRPRPGGRDVADH